MGALLTMGMRFETQRLTVTDWQDVALGRDVDLASLVAGLLTPATTRALPLGWRGEYSIERARRWVADRDRESPTLLVVDRSTDDAIGLVIVFESPCDDGPGIDLRVGYLLSESVRGRGLTTELVAGLVAWARVQSGISTLTGGVEGTNPASARVLLKNGFTQVGSAEDGGLIYRLYVDPADPWDEYAGGWDDDAAARAYSTAAFASLVAVLDDRGFSLAGAKVCDFGCGTGLLTEQLAETVQSIDAVDTSPAMLAELSAKISQRDWANVHPSTELPSSCETHDLVVCSSVLGFVDDYPGTLERLIELLRPNGVFVQWDWERADAGDDRHGLSRREIHDAMTAAGLVAVYVDTAFETSVARQTMRPLIGVGEKTGTADP